jgi:hypothetical protein
VCENSSLTELPGPITGKSKIDVGVPFVNISEVRLSVSTQFALVFVIIYPHPTVVPEGPEIAVPGSRDKEMGPAHARDAQPKNIARPTLR